MKINLYIKNDNFFFGKPFSMREVLRIDSGEITENKLYIPKTCDYYISDELIEVYHNFAKRMKMKVH